MPYKGEKVKLTQTKGISDCIQLATNPDVVADMEELVCEWCHQIEQVWKVGT